MRHKLHHAKQELADIREQSMQLMEQRAALEHQLRILGEQHRMGIVSLTQYDERIRELLQNRTKEEALTALRKQEEALTHAEHLATTVYENLSTRMPKQQTHIGMQVALALVVVLILFGGILILDHPEGMVIANPDSMASQWQNTISPKDPIARPAQRASSP